MKANFMRSNESNIDAVEGPDGKVALLVKETSNPDWAQDPPVVLVGNEDGESIPVRSKTPSSPTIINQTIADVDTWTQIAGIPAERILEWHLGSRTRLVTLAYAFEDTPVTYMTIPPGWSCDRNTDISSTGLWVKVSRLNTIVELEVWTE